MSIQRHVQAGKETTEYLRGVRAEAMGAFMLIVTLAFCCYGVATEKLLACVVGIGLSIPAAIIVVGSYHSYAKARADVKASALAPPPLELRHRSI